MTDEPPTKDVNFEQEINDLLRLKVLCNPLSGLTEEQLESTSALEFFHRTVTGLLRHSNIASVSYPATSASTAKNSCEGDTGCNNGTSTANGNNNNNSSSSSSTKRPRFQTYPASRNTSLLASLFEACPPLRGQFLQRSFLFERTLSESMIVTGPRFFSRSWREEEERQEEEEEEEEEARAEAEAGPSSSSSSEVRQPPRLAVTDVAALRRELVRKPPRPEAKHQMSAHLHCLYSCGLTSAVPSGVLFRWEDGHGFIESGYGERTPAADWIARGGEGAYPFACSKVYDLREYTRGTKWGPFLDEEVEGEEGEGRGPRVDWEKVEAILIALGTNIRMGRRIEFCPVLKNIWEKPFAGVWASSYIPWWKGGESRREKEWGEMEKKDPYGVSGTWLRLECFLDRSDFVRFNFPPDDTLPGDAPRPPLIASEAMCLLLMRVRVAGIEPPGEGDHKDYPVVHFAGVSRVIDEFNGDGSVDSELRGTVRMTPEGEVRWTTSTIYSGQERWKSEGIQLGGIRSARGVVGTWFHKDYDERGPCGPMAFWKVSDSQDKADTRHSHPFDFLCSLTGDLEGEVEVDDNNDDEP